jgi:hypothetical protein
VGIGMSMLTSSSGAAAGVASATGLGVLKSLGIGLVAGVVAAGAATQIAKAPSGASPVAPYVESRVGEAEHAPTRSAVPLAAEAAVLPAPAQAANVDATGAQPEADRAAAGAPSAAPVSEVPADERTLEQSARRALAGARPALVDWGSDSEAPKRVSQPALALALLRRYEEQHPNRALGPEAVVVRIEALALIGNREAATALAERFVAEHPTHPAAVRVRALVGMR